MYQIASTITVLKKTDSLKLSESVCLGQNHNITCVIPGVVFPYALLITRVWGQGQNSFTTDFPLSLSFNLRCCSCVVDGYLTASHLMSQQPRSSPSVKHHLLGHHVVLSAGDRCWKQMLLPSPLVTWRCKKARGILHVNQSEVEDLQFRKSKAES